MWSSSKRLSLCIQFCLLCTFVTAQSSYWLANIQRRGLPAYGNDPSYPVFRNVKNSYGGVPGAVGDGVTDDTAAIQNAIAFGNRCGGGEPGRRYCDSKTTVPALVYIPPGIYKVSSPIAMWYYTQIVGDALNPPTLKATSAVSGIGLLDADPYIPAGDGLNWYQNQNNFWRQVRNLVIDIRDAGLETAGIHWQVAQATSLQNIVFIMKDKSVTNNKQQGIFMENGSGGFMADLTFIGGNIQAFFGNQQFTTRNLTFIDGNIAIYMNFNWLWTFSGLSITGANVGIDMSSGGFDNEAAGSVVVLDSRIAASKIGIATPYVPNRSSPQTANSLVIENVLFVGPAPAVASNGGRVVLPGGRLIESFAQGNAWTTAGEVFTQGEEFNETTCTYANTTTSANSAFESTIQQQLAPIPRPPNLLASDGKYFTRSKPQYEGVPASGFLSAKGFGLLGDGVTDETSGVQNFLNAAAASGQIAYFDHGAYVIGDTIQVPINLKITGEIFPLIMVSGPNFQDQFNPRVAWRVGNPGDVGSVEMSELVFETRGPCPGAIVVQWNIKGTAPGATGMWDSHFRIGGTAGTQLQSTQCIKNPVVTSTQTTFDTCTGAFLLLHITQQAQFYGENIWGWVSDHELDISPYEQINIYNGRGFLIESSDGPVWLWGTSSEHSVLYDYQVSNAKNVFMGAIQHETAYFQGNPTARQPFAIQSVWKDPTFVECTLDNCDRTWGLRILESAAIFVYGGGLYNFFDNWSSDCLDYENCQERMIDIQNSTDIYLWAISTKGSSFLFSYDTNPIVPQVDNKNGFCQTAVLFEIASS